MLGDLAVPLDIWWLHPPSSEFDPFPTYVNLVSALRGLTWDYSTSKIMSTESLKNYRGWHLNMRTTEDWTDDKNGPAASSAAHSALPPPANTAPTKLVWIHPGYQ